MRLQLALNVRDLNEAVEYYSKLFAVKPHKLRDGYANFAIDTPPLKLVLFENPEAEERLNHLGVEVFDEAEIASATDAVRGRGYCARGPTQEDLLPCDPEQGVGPGTARTALGMVSNYRR